jgi:hypothetical protein
MQSYMNIQIYITDGIYIFHLFILLCYFTCDIFLSTIISLKFFVANFWYQYGDKYNYNIHRKYNALRQFVRFTDTGHIASFIYYFYPPFFPIAFNVHFCISVGYLITVHYFGLKDTDGDLAFTSVPSVHNLFNTLCHSAPLVLLIYEYFSKNPCEDCFTQEHLFYSQLWIYSWFVLVYLPWRYMTGDPVYSVLSNGAPKYIIFGSMLTMYSLFYVSNYVGYTMTHL